ncbi:MAG: 4a-hydroxytetrahydrobiopterin dehydratase [Candidatus Omnitrophica bacterium]|nr:4a-hydroxytetrahydrobiopterin dehydratase [Candidatus Omnitrophota bacterium]
MQNTVKHNSRKERIFSPENKTSFSHQNKDQNRIAKVPETSSKKDEAPSLLTVNKAKKSLQYLSGWQLTADHKTIHRDFIVTNFNAAVDLIDRIAVIAEDENHHPDMHLTQYRNLRVALTTHDLGGLSEKDFAVATKINNLPMHTNKNDHRVTLDPPSQKKEQAPIKKSQVGKKVASTKKKLGKTSSSKKNGSKKK